MGGYPNKSDVLLYDDSNRKALLVSDSERTFDRKCQAMVDAAGIVNALVRADGVYGDIKLLTYDH